MVLIGDAAATTDPTWGQGLSLGFRDARVLRDELLSDDDWPAAADRYADEHDRYVDVTIRVEAGCSRFSSTAAWRPPVGVNGPCR